MSSQALSSLLKDQVHGPTTAPITVSVSIDCFVQDWQSLTSTCLSYHNGVLINPFPEIYILYALCFNTCTLMFFSAGLS